MSNNPTFLTAVDYSMNYLMPNISIKPKLLNFIGVLKMQNVLNVLSLLMILKFTVIDLNYYAEMKVTYFP